MRVALRIDRSAGQRNEYHQQIINQIIDKVATGVLRPGDRLDTIAMVQRRLALSHATAARAYTTLEQRGVIETRLKAGSWIAGISPTLMKELRLEYGIRQVGPLMQTFGVVHLDAQQIKSIFKAAIANQERMI